jgi:hypothetical protein
VRGECGLTAPRHRAHSEATFCPRCRTRLPARGSFCGPASLGSPALTGAGIILGGAKGLSCGKGKDEGQTRR